MWLSGTICQTPSSVHCQCNFQATILPTPWIVASFISKIRSRVTNLVKIMVPFALPLFVLISCSRASQPVHPIVNWTHTILCQCFCCPSNERDTKHFQLPFSSLFSLIAPPISNVFWDCSALLHCTALAFSLLAMQDLLFFFCKLFSMEFGSSPLMQFLFQLYPSFRSICASAVALGKRHSSV